MKRIILPLLMLLVCTGGALAVGTGDINVGYPTFYYGYTNKDWGFSSFEGTVALFNIASTNLKSSDQSVAVVSSNLNGTTTVIKADVTNKSMAVLNHIISGFTLYPPGTGVGPSATSPFPAIWVKGDTVNTVTATAEKPSTYLTGTDADKFYQTGLTLLAPYWDSADYQWTVYVYANKDILSQTQPSSGQGKILDPRVSTMRWWDWADDSEGIPRKAWGYRTTAEGLSLFNTLPLINSSDTSVIKNYLISNNSTAETKSDLGAIDGYAEASIPQDGKIYYNTDRNTDTVNGFTISGRSQIGLMYVAPSGTNSHRTEKLRVQFLAVWPSGVGLTSGAKSCDIGLYQRTTN